MKIARYFKTLLFSSVLILSGSQLFGQIRLTQAPYLQDLRENEVTIIWETDKIANGWVELAPNDGNHFYSQEWPEYYDSKLGIKNIGKLHRVTLKGLQPNTTYRYRVLSQEAIFTDNPDVTLYGTVAATEIFRYRPLEFTTLGGKTDRFNFVVMNDVHEDSTLFSNLIKASDAASADFVIFNGDMVSSMPEENTITRKFLNYATDAFASEKPFFMVRGNHETRSRYADTYMDYFKTPTDLPYYTFTFGNTFFIILDSGEDKPDDDIEYFSRADYDTYRNEEMLWLKQVLQSDACKNATNRIAIMHIPPVGTSSWYGDCEVRRLFLPLLNEADIDLMLCGHTHQYGYVGKGEFTNNFPVIINDNEAAVAVSVKESDILIKIYDRKGKQVHEFRISDKR